MDGTGSGRRRWKAERGSCWRWKLELVRERRCLKRKGESGASVGHHEVAHVQGIGREETKEVKGREGRG